MSSLVSSFECLNINHVETINDVFNTLFQLQPSVVCNLTHVYKDDKIYKGVTCFNSAYDKGFKTIIANYNADNKRTFLIKAVEMSNNHNKYYDSVYELIISKK